MGSPVLQLSFDYLCFYPYVVLPTVKYFKNVHPNYITIFNLIIKYYSFAAAMSWNWQRLLWLGTLERYLDCLDGSVARKFEKCSTVGHCLDKYSDLIFRFGTAVGIIQNTLPLLQEDIFAPLLLLLVVFSCPAVFIYDAFRGKIDNLNTSADSIAIIIEDNATLLCLILPLLQFFCVQRCSSHG